MNEESTLQKKNLEILKERTRKRLENGKDKTEAYQKAVKKLFKDYTRRYKDRQLNKFQYDQIKAWVGGKLQLSNDRYAAYRERVINKYKTTLNRVKTVSDSKKTQIARAKKMASDQQSKNR